MAEDRASNGSDRAHRVVLSYPDSLSKRARNRISQAYYLSYLRKILDRPVIGEELEEFTDVGCCGSQLHLTLRVESIDGGDRVGLDTHIDLEGRPATPEDTLANPWAVQNEID